MTTEHAARFIRAHGIDAWPTENPRRVLVMHVTTERRPGGIICRAIPCIIPTGLSAVHMWLGY